jgi:hypothetical protein
VQGLGNLLLVVVVVLLLLLVVRLGLPISRGAWPRDM